MKIFFVFFAFFMATTFFVYGQNETTDGPIKKIVTNAVPSNITVTESDRTLLGIEFDQIEATVKVRFKCTDKVLTLSSTNQYEIKYLEIENEIAYGLMARVYDNEKVSFKVKRYFHIQLDPSFRAQEVMSKLN